MFPSGQAGPKCPLICSSEDSRPGPAPFSSMLALVKVPRVGDNINVLKASHCTPPIWEAQQNSVHVFSGAWCRSLGCSKSRGSGRSLFVHFLLGFSVTALLSPIWVLPNLIPCSLTCHSVSTAAAGAPGWSLGYPEPTN